MEKDQEKKQDMDLVLIDQLFKNSTNNTTKTHTNKTDTTYNVCSESTTGNFLNCDPHKLLVSSLAQFSPRKAQM